MDKSKLPKMDPNKVIKEKKKKKTNPGAVDDDIKRRIRERKKMLEDAGKF